MMMLTHRICMALRGLGRLNTVERVSRLRAEMLLRAQHRRSRQRHPADRCPGRGTAGPTHVLSWNRTKFLMLWKMALPSSTALLWGGTVWAERSCRPGLAQCW